MLVDFTDAEEGMDLWINPDAVEIVRKGDMGSDTTFIRFRSGKGVTVDGKLEAVVDALLGVSDVPL